MLKQGTEIVILKLRECSIIPEVVILEKGILKFPFCYINFVGLYKIRGK